MEAVIPDTVSLRLPPSGGDIVSGNAASNDGLRPIGEVVNLRVFDLDGAIIREVSFAPEAKVWTFYVEHRGCDDDAATLTVAEGGVKFVHEADRG